MRHDHVIATVRGDRIPARWILMAAAVRRSPVEADERMHRLELTDMCAVRLRLLDGVCLTEREDRYGDAAEWWADADLRFPSGTATVLIARQALQLWTVLGLWDHITNGEFELVGTDPANPGSDVGPRRKRFRGVCILEDPPFVVQLRSVRTGATVRLVDVRNYGVPGPPEEMAPGAAARELADWLIAWVAEIKRLRLGTWQNTLASQAYYGWRRSYLTDGVAVHTDALALSLERLSYYGGRCECAYVGGISSGTRCAPWRGHYGQPIEEIWDHGPIYRLDINSAYAAAAEAHDVPTGLVGSGFLHAEPTADLAKLAHEGIAAVTVTTDVPCVPYSPVRDRLLSQVLAGEPIDWTQAGDLADVYYPIGTFRTVLCGPELALAVTYGRIDRVHAGAHYVLRPAFRKWAQRLWLARLEAKSRGDREVAAQLKLLPVLLFGKFGQRLRAWRDQPGEPTRAPYASWYDLDPDTRQLRRWRSVGYRVQHLVEGGETSESCPMVCAWINSLARMRLYELIRTAGYHNTYYWDTDSLWVSSAGFEQLSRAGEIGVSLLGKLKVEGEYQRVEFVGPKHYIADGQVTLAAMPKSAQTDGSLCYWWVDQEGFPAALPHSHPPRPVQHTLFRSVPLAYTRGHVSPSGWVLPYRCKAPAELV